MSLWDDLSNSFITAFTNPGKANFGDIATVVGSLGGAGLAGAGIAAWAAPSYASMNAAAGIAPAFSAAATPSIGVSSDAAFLNSIAAPGANTAYITGSTTAGFSASTAAPSTFFASVGKGIAAAGAYALQAAPLALQYAQIAAKKLGFQLPAGLGGGGGGSSAPASNGGVRTPSAGPQIGISLPGAAAAAPVQAGMSPIIIVLVIGVACGMFLLARKKK